MENLCRHLGIVILESLTFLLLAFVYLLNSKKNNNTRIKYTAIEHNSNFSTEEISDGVVGDNEFDMEDK